MPSGIYGNGLIVCPTPDSGVCRQSAATALSSTLSAVSTPYRFDSLRITDYPRRSSESSQPLTCSESRFHNDFAAQRGLGLLKRFRGAGSLCDQVGGVFGRPTRILQPARSQCALNY